MQKLDDAFTPISMTKPMRHTNNDIKGTPFQIKVWEALLKIPMGEVSTYSGKVKLVFITVHSPIMVI